MNPICKKILCLTLALACLVPLAPGVSAFTNESAWATSELTAMLNEGLIPSTLQDADMSLDISRLDMCRAAVLAYEKILGQAIPVPQTPPFSDTSDEAASKAYAVGLVGGDGDGTYRPDDALTRLEFFVIIDNFIKAVSYPTSDGNYSDLKQFADAYQLPAWGREQTRLAVGLGIVSGSGNELNWRSKATREQGLALFYRTYLLVTDQNEPVPPTTEPEDPAAPEPEPEVPEGFINLAGWASEAVNTMDTMGLIPASVKATPMDGPITRQNLCRVIMLAYKQLMGVSDGDLGTPEDVFSDTSDLDVLNAYRLGIVNGVGDGKFAPDSPITRQDAFVMSINFLNAIGYPYFDDETATLDQFKDDHRVAEYAEPATRLMVSIKAVSGDNKGNINPRDNIVCQESLSIFYRIHNFVTTWVAPAEKPDERPEEEIKESNDVVEFAMQFLGYNYVYGGKNPEDGFDCSGFVYYIYKQFGHTLNPGATNQWNTLGNHAVISRGDLRPGDLVFFSGNGQVSGMEHVGLYIGEGKMIHASTPRTGVIITDLSEPYYVRRFLGGKRVLE